MRRFCWLLVVWLIASACRDAAYSAASKKDTIDEWRVFLKEHPDDENVPGAKDRLAELEFAEAQKVHSVVAYKRFLAEFPDSSKSVAARALLETLRFNAAKEKGTSLALRQFIAEHPDGRHRPEAEELLSKLELAELTQLSDERTLAELVVKHADDPRAEAATERLDELAWAKASTAAALYAYLRDFPAGKHRDDARTRLVSVQLDGLLVSGDLRAAKALAASNPLAKNLPDLAARLAHAEQVGKLSSSRDEAVLRTLPDYMLRPFDEVVRSLASPDPLDRWQAAEELGFHVSIHALPPLLEAFRMARLPIVRQKCFEAMGRVLRALPRPVADYEVATRIENLKKEASDTQLLLSMAVLLDVSGHLDQAAGEYQRTWEPSNPDPVVLRRWAAIRLERRQFFSAAVAARQLSLHAAKEAKELVPEGANALASARDLCSAADEARYALVVLEAVAKEKTEFPDDVTAFVLRAREQKKLVEAKLRDAELALLTLDARARRCDDNSVLERMADGEKRRLESLAQLRAKPTKDLGLVLEVLRERDPSPAVREASAN